MNEQLQKALADILQLLIKSAETVGHVATEQLPILVQEYLKWGLAKQGLDMVIAALLMLVCWRISKRVQAYFKARIESYGNDNWQSGVGEARAGEARAMYCWFGCVAPAIVGIFGAAIMVSSIFTAVQIWIAPRVYLLEQVKELMK